MPPCHCRPTCHHDIYADSPVTASRWCHLATAGLHATMISMQIHQWLAVGDATLPLPAYMPKHRPNVFVRRCPLQNEICQIQLDQEPRDCPEVKHYSRSTKKFVNEHCTTVHGSSWRRLLHSIQGLLNSSWCSSFSSWVAYQSKSSVERPSRTDLKQTTTSSDHDLHGPTKINDLKKTFWIQCLHNLHEQI